ncbi:MAG: outer membrane protein assembly factor BamE [Gammaproteobacteria bacterium]
MHPKNPTPTFVLVTLTLALTAGCSRTGIPSPADLPIVYKIDVQQGNLVTQDMLAQLEPGMDKTKVKYIMGTPLVTDTFHADRWDYIYTMQERGGKRTQRRISLFFTDGKLARVEGNVKPAAGAIAPSTEAQATTVEVPEAEKSLVEKMKGTVSGEKEESKDKAAATESPATAAAGDEPSESVATDVQDETAAEDSQFAVDNDAEAVTPAQSDGEAAGRDDPLLPRFQAESDLENAVLTDEAPPPEPRATAAEAAGSADAAETGDPAAGAKGNTAAATEVTIPVDAPPPPKKGFFRRMLEKVGVGDNEGGEYESADPKYRDPSNPDTQ